MFNRVNLAITFLALLIMGICYFIIPDEWEWIFGIGSVVTAFILFIIYIYKKQKNHESN
jgi:uncharacterized membrane protein (DUF485 family)